jgi:hypothetical protein
MSARPYLEAAHSEHSADLRGALPRHAIELLLFELQREGLLAVAAQVEIDSKV